MIQKLSVSIHNLIFFILGAIFLIISILTFLIPFLPTVPFLIFSLVFFLKASKNLYYWFFYNRFFGNFTKKIIGNTKKMKKYILIYLSLLWIYSFFSIFFLLNDFYPRFFAVIVVIGVTLMMIFIPNLLIPPQKTLIK